MLKLYNTLTRKKEDFKPLQQTKGRSLVGLYACGPTVYFFAHIGNLRTYLFEDILKRVLIYNKHRVKHVMNITDVGHLTSDDDIGEDKMEKGAKREKKTVWEIARFYTRAFKNDLKLLNIRKPSVFVKATDTIKEQIKLIEKLEKKGFTYKVLDGVYFDSSKLQNYGELWGEKEKQLKAGARVKMVAGKKNPTDFALWKFTPPGEKRQMEWESPWAKGFPGWHTECVVMGISNLGIPFDIHCGGIDHIPIHHTNEIAQAKAAYGKPLAKYWMHGDFLVLKEDKMAKSLGDVILLSTIIEKGFSPLAYRYLILNAHYRSLLTFSWEAITNAQNSINNLYEKVSEIKPISKKRVKSTKIGREYKDKFIQAINDDLDMPQALAIMWHLVKDETISNQEKYHLLIKFDKIFGLGLNKVKKTRIPRKIRELVVQREKYRLEKNWVKSDEMRKEIEILGYGIEDSVQGTKIVKI
ncbi:cysteine--tRNA ligase [Patescibacteria group bacterium]|nr:cysteine--tRNA ligase [Patescibacteria group bacterium]